MPRNIEIKARIADLAAFRAAILRIADPGVTEIVQDDTLFPSSRIGRVGFERG